MKKAFTVFMALSILAAGTALSLRPAFSAVETHPVPVLNNRFDAEALVGSEADGDEDLINDPVYFDKSNLNTVSVKNGLGVTWFMLDSVGMDIGREEAYTVEFDLKLIGADAGSYFNVVYRGDESASTAAAGNYAGVQFMADSPYAYGVGVGTLNNSALALQYRYSEGSVIGKTLKFKLRYSGGAVQMLVGENAVPTMNVLASPVDGSVLSTQVLSAAYPRFGIASETSLKYEAYNIKIYTDADLADYNGKLSKFNNRYTKTGLVDGENVLNNTDIYLLGSDSITCKEGVGLTWLNLNSGTLDIAQNENYTFEFDFRANKAADGDFLRVIYRGLGNAVTGDMGDYASVQLGLTNPYAYAPGGATLGGGIAMQYRDTEGAVVGKTLKIRLVYTAAKVAFYVGENRVSETDITASPIDGAMPAMSLLNAALPRFGVYTSTGTSYDISNIRIYTPADLEAYNNAMNGGSTGSGESGSGSSGESGSGEPGPGDIKPLKNRFDNMALAGSDTLMSDPTYSETGRDSITFNHHLANTWLQLSNDAMEIGQEESYTFEFDVKLNATGAGASAPYKSFSIFWRGVGNVATQETGGVGAIPTDAAYFKIMVSGNNWCYDVKAGALNPGGDPPGITIPATNGNNEGKTFKVKLRYGVDEGRVFLYIGENVLPLEDAWALNGREISESIMEALPRFGFMIDEGMKAEFTNIKIYTDQDMADYLAQFPDEETPYDENLINENTPHIIAGDQGWLFEDGVLAFSTTPDENFTGSSKYLFTGPDISNDDIYTFRSKIKITEFLGAETGNGARLIFKFKDNDNFGSVDYTQNGYLRFTVLEDGDRVEGLPAPVYVGFGGGTDSAEGQILDIKIVVSPGGVVVYFGGQKVFNVPQTSFTASLPNVTGCYVFSAFAEFSELSLVKTAYAASKDPFEPVESDVESAPGTSEDGENAKTGQIPLAAFAVLFAASAAALLLLRNKRLDTSRKFR